MQCTQILNHSHENSSTSDRLSLESRHKILNQVFFPVSYLFPIHECRAASYVNSTSVGEGWSRIGVTKGFPKGVTKIEGHL